MADFAIYFVIELLKKMETERVIYKENTVYPAVQSIKKKGSIRDKQTDIIIY